ncbi:hypothetical protein FRC17_009330 [Serendipita sp. 399]|nr:hypothetical protein FRC17_009330 [Serendipita sp. 399]
MDGMLATHMPVSTDEGEAYSMMKSILMPSSASFGPSDYGMPPVPQLSHPTPMTSYDPGLISSAHAHYQQRHANNILSSTVPFPLEDDYPHDNHDSHEHHEPTDDEDEDEIMGHIDTNRSNKIVKGNGSVPVGKTFQCPICLRIYPRVGRQEACINKHNGDKKYPCKGKCGVLDCPKAFYGMEDLRRHLRPLEKKRWKCPNCLLLQHQN